MANTVFKNQSLLSIILDTKNTDLASATVKKIIFKKPKGQKGEYVATVVDETKLRYDFQPGDIDQAGMWKFQAHIEIGGKVGLGEVFSQYFEEPV